MKYSDTNFTVPALVLSFRFVIIKYLSGFVTYYRAFHTDVILSMHIMMEKLINVSLSVSPRIRKLKKKENLIFIVVLRLRSTRFFWHKNLMKIPPLMEDTAKSKTNCNGF